MSLLQHFLAQTANAVPVNAQTLLVAYGPMGLMLAWFMFRFEALLREFRTLSHRIEGMTRANLVDVLSRSSSGTVARGHAEKMLASIEARDNKGGSGPPFGP